MYTQQATPSIVENLHNMREEIQFSFAELLIVERTHYLKLLDHEIKLQELSRATFLFLKFIRENAVNDFILASAELELSNLMEFVMQIEFPEMMKFTGNVSVQLE